MFTRQVRQLRSDGERGGYLPNTPVDDPFRDAISPAPPPAPLDDSSLNKFQWSSRVIIKVIQRVSWDSLKSSVDYNTF